MALLGYYTMHFGWNFELLYCRWLFLFCLFPHRFNSFYLTMYIFIYLIQYICAILNVISFAFNRMSWRAGNWSTEY